MLDIRCFYPWHIFSRFQEYSGFIVWNLLNSKSSLGDLICKTKVIESKPILLRLNSDFEIITASSPSIFQRALEIERYL